MEIELIFYNLPSCVGREKSENRVIHIAHCAQAGGKIKWGGWMTDKQRFPHDLYQMQATEHNYLGLGGGRVDFQLTFNFRSVDLFNSTEN